MTSAVSSRRVLNHVVVSPCARGRRVSARRRDGDARSVVLVHDITPLNSIIGFTTHVRKQRATSLAATDLEYLQRVEVTGHTLLSLVNDILDLAKVEGGTLEAVLAPTDIETLVLDTVAQGDGYPRAPGVAFRGATARFIRKRTLDAAREGDAQRFLRLLDPDEPRRRKLRRRFARLLPARERRAREDDRLLVPAAPIQHELEQ